MKRNGERGVRNSESIINRVMDESGSEVWVHAHTEDGYKSGIELASQDGDRFKQNRVFDISKMTRSRLDAIDDVIMVDLNDETGSEVNYGFYPVEHYRVKRQNSVTESKRNNASEKSYYRPVDTILKVFRKSSSSVSREDRVLHKSTSKHQSKKSKSNKNMNKTQRSDCASRIGMNEMTVYSNKTSHLSRPDLERLYLQSKQALMNLSIQTEEGYKMILDKRLKSAKKLVADTEKMKKKLFRANSKIKNKPLAEESRYSYLQSNAADRPILPRYDMNKVRLTSGKILYDDQIDLLATFNGTLSIHPTIKHRKDNISQYNDI